LVPSTGAACGSADAVVDSWWIPAANLYQAEQNLITHFIDLLAERHSWYCNAE